MRNTKNTLMIYKCLVTRSTAYLTHSTISSALKASKEPSPCPSFPPAGISNGTVAKNAPTRFRLAACSDAPGRFAKT